MQTRRKFSAILGIFTVGIAAMLIIFRKPVSVFLPKKTPDPSFGVQFGISLPQLSANPSPLPVDGTIWYDSTLKQLRVTNTGAATTWPETQ